MSGAALGWAKAQIAPTTIAKAVLVCLADYADADGVAWPSVPSLAKEVQVSDRTVQRALRALAECGIVSVTERVRQDGGQTSNGYQLAMPAAPPGDSVSPPRCQVVTPPVTLLSPANEPPIEPSLSDERDSPARAKRSYSKAFEAAWLAYPHHKGRSSKPKASDEFAKLPPDERASLPAAAERFAANVDDACGGKGAPDMARWLREGKHMNWQADEATASKSATFDGPPELRASVVAVKDEDFARRWIDHYCAWLPAERRLVARTNAVAATLNRELADWAKRAKVTIISAEHEQIAA